MKLPELWDELERKDAAGQEAGFFSRRILRESGLDLNVAVEKPSNRRLLLFRIRSGSVDTRTKLPASKGFEVSRLSMPGDDSTYCTLQLAVTEVRFRDVFSTLAQDVLDRVLVGKNERESVSLFISRLQQWQTFFKRHSVDGLSEEEQRGLYGELWFLRFLIQQDIAGISHVACWTGPLGANQDFQFQRCAVEVKVTTGQQDQRLQISSERQLDTTGIGSLFIAHQSLDMRAESGETLNGIVRNIRTLVESRPAEREQFETLLFSAGYLDQQAELYERTGYSHREINYFAVKDGFPRIVESDLQPGVGNVHYTISVSQCRQYAVPETTVLSAIQGNYD